MKKNIVLCVFLVSCIGPSSQKREAMRDAYIAIDRAAMVALDRVEACIDRGGSYDSCAGPIDKIVSKIQKIYTFFLEASGASYCEAAAYAVGLAGDVFVAEEPLRSAISKAARVFRAALAECP